MKTEFFQLTTSRGDRLYGNMFYVRLVIFNSRPLVEIDNLTVTKLIIYIFFNSRPLVEIDLYPDKRGRICYFSTHDLSWRSTAKLHNKSLKFCIFLDTLS